MHASQTSNECAISCGKCLIDFTPYCISASCTRTRKTRTQSLEAAQRRHPRARRDRVVIGVFGHRRCTDDLLLPTGKQHNVGEPMQCRRRTCGLSLRRSLDGEEEGAIASLGEYGESSLLSAPVMVVVAAVIELRAVDFAGVAGVGVVVVAVIDAVIVAGCVVVVAAASSAVVFGYSSPDVAETIASALGTASNTLDETRVGSCGASSSWFPANSKCLHCVQ